MFEDDRSGDAGWALPARWRDSAGLAPLLMLAVEPLAGRSCAELVEMLAGWERQAGWLAARQTELLARLASQIRAEFAAQRAEAQADGRTVLFTEETVENDIEAQVASALRLAGATAADRVATAEALTCRLPDTQAALAAGTISYWHAATVVRQTAHLDQDAARAIERAVLPHAARDTVGGLRRRLRRACMIASPTDTCARARQATDERTVTLTPGEDGTALLQAVGPAPALQAVYDALDIAAGRAPAGDARRIGARRFDALVDGCVRTLDNARCPGQPRTAANVYVTIDLPTLLGLQDNPAQLLGYGPLPAPLARQLALDNGWRRLITDEITGAPKDLGRLRRFPDAPLREWIRLRDQTCVFPGCYRAAHRCALDHRRDAAHGGPTSKTNLAPLCPKHHRVKDAGWRYQLHPGQITWTSPHQLTYTRYLPDPNPVIPADLKRAGQAETRREHTPAGHDEGPCFLATGDQDPDRHPRPPRPLRPDHPNYDPEPPVVQAEPAPPALETPALEPPPLEPSGFEPSGFEPSGFEPSGFKSPGLEPSEFAPAELPPDLDAETGPPG